MFSDATTGDLTKQHVKKSNECEPEELVANVDRIVFFANHRHCILTDYCYQFQ